MAGNMGNPWGLSLLSLEMQTRCLHGLANFCLVYDYLVVVQILNACDVSCHSCQVQV